MTVLKLRRVGAASCALLATVTLICLVTGARLGWLTLGLTGLLLLAGAIFDELLRRPVRAVMAASGATLVLFGLLPWWALNGGFIS